MYEKIDHGQSMMSRETLEYELDQAWEWGRLMENRANDAVATTKNQSETLREYYGISNAYTSEERFIKQWRNGVITPEAALEAIETTHTDCNRQREALKAAKK
jgi:hypothetical protein